MPPPSSRQGVAEVTCQQGCWRSEPISSQSGRPGLRSAPVLPPEVGLQLAHAGMLALRTDIESIGPASERPCTSSGSGLLAGSRRGAGAPDRYRVDPGRPGFGAPLYFLRKWASSRLTQGCWRSGPISSRSGRPGFGAPASSRLTLSKGAHVTDAQVCHGHIKALPRSVMGG